MLVGPNGSGKSTLLRTLVGLQPALARLGWRSAGRDAQAHRRGGEGDAASPASSPTDPTRDTSPSSISSPSGDIPIPIRATASDPRTLAAVERPSPRWASPVSSDRRFSELSDGERQKALVARAIAQDCPLLVLDEPTAFLDAPARVEIFHLARELAHSAGKAVVLSTHDIDQALRYADTLLLMDREHRLEKGAPEDLAVSGAIGRAFDGEGFRFDLGAGSFRAAERGIGLKVELVGPEGPIKDWARRLLERLGCSVCRAGSEASAIRVALLDDRPAFELGGRVVQGYSELARLLEELLSGLAGPHQANSPVVRTLRSPSTISPMG